MHAICCTGANLEEDVFNLVAHDHYERVPHYRDLTPADEQALLERHLNRVTDTCIPEEEAMRRIERDRARGVDAPPTQRGERLLPARVPLPRAASAACSRSHYQIDPKDSWLLAAGESEPADLRARLGGLDARQHVRRARASTATSRTCTRCAAGIEYMMRAGRVVHATTAPNALDRLLPDRRRHRRRLPDLRRADAAAGPAAHDVPLWGYFCQISDSTTSYGSYSGAVPNEKITWGKLGVDTPKFIIESDATIVAPLIFALRSELVGLPYLQLPTPNSRKRTDVEIGNWRLDIESWDREPYSDRRVLRGSSDAARRAGRSAARVAVTTIVKQAPASN